MATKAKAKKSARGSQAVAKRIAADSGVSLPKLPSSGSLIGRQHAIDASSRKEKQDNSIATQVARCLVDNFKGFSTSEIDGIRVNGLTLRQTLTTDKTSVRDHPDCDIKFGKYFNE